MIKKLLAIATFTTAAVLSSPASAIDLGTAFSSLTGASGMTSTQAAQVYKSASRTSMDLGGVQMHVARSSVNLLSISPPSLSVGCSGISAHFGGFSYISGSQIQQFITNIEQGIPGAVLQLAIKLLCPQCEAVLQAMEKLAQDASKIAIDSCHVSSQIAGMAQNSGLFNNPQNGNSATNFCAQQQSGSGAQSDSLMAELSSACSSANGALNTLSGWANGADSSLGPGTPEQKKQTLSQLGMMGNVTWEALGAAGWCPPSNGAIDSSTCTSDDLHTKLVLMNLLGTTIVKPADTASSTSSTAGSSGTSGNYENYAPKVAVKDIYDLFMCGSPLTASGDLNTNAAASPTIAHECSPFWTNTWRGMTLYDCADDYVHCLKVTSKGPGDNMLFQGNGFMFQTYDLLRYGVNQIVSRTDFNWSDPKAQKLAALLGAAPYPLYQAINAAAVYPAAAMDLIDSMGLSTAQLMTYTIVEDMLTTVGRPTAQTQGVSQQVLKNLYAALDAIRTEHDAHRKAFGNEIALQEALSREILQINQTIQRQVLSDDFMGNTRFASALVTKKQ
jgi:hypothetical protein